MAKCLPILALKFIPDGFQGFATGVIRALGKQKEASKITLCVAYLVTIPVACIFTFVFNMGVAGLVCGSACSHILQSILYLRLILKQDWDVISKNAVERIEAETTKADEKENQILAFIQNSDDNFKRVK